MPRPAVDLAPGEALFIEDPAPDIPSGGWLCRCARCGHIWYARIVIPTACASCKATGWRTVAGLVKRGPKPAA